eukprot:scaffold698_cov397-Pinguiococcus_pyrenoidosus.AAC.6
MGQAHERRDVRLPGRISTASYVLPCQSLSGEELASRQAESFPSARVVKFRRLHIRQHGRTSLLRNRPGIFACRAVTYGSCSIVF